MSFTTIGAAQGKTFKIGGILIDTQSAAAMGRSRWPPWCSARCGCAARRAVSPALGRTDGGREAQEEIEDVKRQEAMA